MTLLSMRFLYCGHHHLVFYSPNSPVTVSPIGNIRSHYVSMPNAKRSSHSISKKQDHAAILQDSSVSKPDWSLRKYAAPTTVFTEQQQQQLCMKLDKAEHLLRGVDGGEGLVVVDTIQRLGIDYYFQHQIEAILQRNYHPIADDLHEISLRFRLLRQQGFNISTDVFGKFKDNKLGKHFNNELAHDTKGLMSLYEASHLSVEGEDVLEEGGNFSEQILRERARDVHDLHHTLMNPCHKSLARFTAKDSLLQLGHQLGTNSHEWFNVLKQVQILDSERVKSIHQTEIAEVSKWWKELGLGKELKFARNEPAKWYMWPMAMLTDPSLSAERVELTKPISLIYFIDDIFDVYGTIHELTLFTDVVTRWDLDSSEQLPEYMKICFKALNDLTNEISDRIYREHGWNPVNSIRLAWASLCKAFLVEARWFGCGGKPPKSEEYLENAIVSSGVHVVLVHLFFMLGQNVTNQSVELVNHMPSLISSAATILRLWDDLGTAEDENQEGQDGSYLQYYMNEQQGMTREGARAHVFDKISKAWKQLNEACISPNPYFSKSFKDGALNLARMVPLMYNYDDNHHLPVLSHHITSLLL